MNFGNLLQSFGMEQWQFICFIFVPVFIIVCIVFVVLRKKQQDNFIANNPDASLLVLSVINGSGTIKIHSVDGEKPVETTHGLQKAILVVPGVHKVISSVNIDATGSTVYLSKSGFTPSNTQTAKTEQEITIKRGQNYKYLFDAENATYAIDEIEGEK